VSLFQPRRFLHKKKYIYIYIFLDKNYFFLSEAGSYSSSSFHPLRGRKEEEKAPASLKKKEKWSPPKTFFFFCYSRKAAGASLEKRKVIGGEGEVRGCFAGERGKRELTTPTPKNFAYYVKQKYPLCSDKFLSPFLSPANQLYHLS